MKGRIKWIIQKVLKRGESNSIKNSIIGLNNTVSNKGSLVNVVVDIQGNNNQINIGEYSHLSNCHLYIRGNNHFLSIGTGCKSSGGSFWFEDENCSIDIDNGTTLEDAHIAAVESGSKVQIGKGCMFAVGVIIRTSDSHSIIDLQSGKRINPAGNVTIGDRVWLGAFSNVLKGVNIGDGSIIGTGAIVTTDVPANTLAVGIPAKVIKRNVKWDVQRIN